MPTISVNPWGKSPAGAVERYTLTNDRGNSVSVLNLGGIVQSIMINATEMVLGYDSIDGYLSEYPYYGALIGRYGNRIGNARVVIDGKTYQLSANENGNQLHGGTEGFDTKIWEVEQWTTDTAAVLKLSRTSPDGEMGYPGNLKVSCTYEWSNDNALRLHYQATTDKDTVVNLTNHCYFHIGGLGKTVLDQTLRVDADYYTPVNEQMIPLGEMRPVAGTPFDFRKPKPIGQDIHAEDRQLRIADGYDHNFALNEYDGSLREVAVVTDPDSGRVLRCLTTEPGLQVFTTNFPPGKFTMRGGEPTPKYSAICLETQHFPDAPNQENFVTPLLRVGETYDTTTIYRFE